MFSLRLFPSFEKPVARQRYINVQPQRPGYGGIGGVLVLSALCGIGIVLALPETPQLSSAAPRTAVTATLKQAPAIETTATAAADDDEIFRKLSALCTDKPTARRACAEAKAAKEARLAAALARAEADPPKTQSASAAAGAGKASATAKASVEPEEANAEVPSPAPRQKTKTARVADEAPVDRLVHVYDHVAPDGRRVPVYRRSNGRYEFGAIVDGEYQQSRSAELTPPRRSYFGLQ